MNENIPIKQLNLFIAVVEQGGITQAAKALRLTPSAISRGLSQLEETLNIQLISRSTRHSKTTPAGDEFYQRLGPILRDLSATLDQAGSQASQPSGRLAITCSIAFGTAHLMNLSTAYRLRFPDVSLDFHLSDKIERLHEGAYDLAIRISKSVPSNYSVRHLADIQWGYFASPDYLSSHGEPASVSDLANHKCLIYRGIDSAWNYFGDDGQLVAVQFKKPIIEVNSSFVLLEGALKNQGVVYLPSYLSGPYAATGELRQILEKQTRHNEAHLYTVHLPNRYKNPVIQSFIDFCFAWMNPVPPWARKRQDAAQ